MKKFLFAFAMTASLFSVSYAQPGGGAMGNPEEMATRQTKMMTKELSLDAKQQEAVSAINLKYAEMSQDNFTANKGNRDAIQKGMADILTKKSSEIKALLNADQAKKYDDIEAKMKQRQQNGGNFGEGRGKKDDDSKADRPDGGDLGGGGGDISNPQEMATRQTQRMTDALSLSPAQQTSVSAINLKYANQLKDAASSLKSDRSAFQKVMGDLEVQKLNEIKEVLNADQIKKLDEISAKMKQRQQNGGRSGGGRRGMGGNRMGN